MPPTDALLAALQRMLDAEARMTPGPWEVREDHDGPHYGNVRLRTSAGLTIARTQPQCGRPHVGEIENNAQGIAAFRNVARPLLEALIAATVEIQLRRSHPYRACEQRRQWDTDAAMQRLAEALEVQP